MVSAGMSVTVSLTASASVSVNTNVNPDECDHKREGVRTELLIEWLTAIQISVSSARSRTMAM